MEKELFLCEEFSKLKIRLSHTQVQQLLSYYEFLIEKNKSMNLTAIVSFEEVVSKHYLDSVLVAGVLDLNHVQTLIDVGSGAGFPGIPLKIIFPHIQMVLLDSLNKRIGFLNEVVDRLQLKQIKAVHARAEDAAHDRTYREQFDLCVSRAVANLSTLTEYCLPFVRPGGEFIAYKSADVEEECVRAATAAGKLGGGAIRTDLQTLPGTDIVRTMVVIPKKTETPSKYPRRAGVPEKSPIS